MNHAATSKSELLAAAKKIIMEQGAEQFNIRMLAKNCGVAVGSIYNYFPTKAELSVAIVSDFWQDAFHENAPCQLCDNFPQLVEQVYHTADSCLGTNRSFFTTHPAIVGDRDKASGRVAMEACFSHIKAALLQALQADLRVNPQVWAEDFTQEQFVDFVFCNLLRALSGSETNCTCLLQVIARVLYR